MLFTRCPHCDTIFRVTDQALAKAGGRVRCGRCANVFDATADLRESPDGAAIGRRPASAASAASAAGDDSAATPADERAAPQTPAVAAGVAAAKAADAQSAKGTKRTQDNKDTKDAPSARRPAQSAANVKKPTGTSPPSDSTTITPAEIEEVLAGTQTDD